MGEKQLIFRSIIRFLREEVENGQYSPQAVESIQVAKQCLESAFDIDSETNENSLDLVKLVQGAERKGNIAENVRQPTEKEKTMAEALKNQGNICMKENKYEDAVTCYTKAIDLSPRNAVYYCNRAAAYSKLEQQENAIADCKTALVIDPAYSKAYGRMGIAYSSLGDYAKAVESYRKGLELDPLNENCQQNLSLAEERLRASASPSGGGGAAGGANMPWNLGAMMDSPWMRDMVQRLMTDPAAQNIISGLVGNSFGATNGSQASASGGTSQTSTTTTKTSSATATPTSSANLGGNLGNGSTEGAVNPNLGAFLQLGQQFAQQLQSSNPQLVEQLRQLHRATVSGQPGTPGNSSGNGNTGADDTRRHTREPGNSG